MFVVFVSIDKPKRWSKWHSGSTDVVYHSPFFDNEHEVELFLDIVKQDYPKSNLAHNNNYASYKYYIKYVVLNYDEKDIQGFDVLKRMMRAYNSYDERKVEL